MIFRTKPVEVEAITFEELVNHGRAQGVPCYNGMPWSFDYKGHAITHENDECYLVPTSEGTMRFTPGDMLTEEGDELVVYTPELFAAAFDSVVPLEEAPSALFAGGVRDEHKDEAVAKLLVALEHKDLGPNALIAEIGLKAEYLMLPPQDFSTRFLLPAAAQLLQAAAVVARQGKAQAERPGPRIIGL